MRNALTNFFYINVNNIQRCALSPPELHQSQLQTISIVARSVIVVIYIVDDARLIVAHLIIHLPLLSYITCSSSDR